MRSVYYQNSLWKFFLFMVALVIGLASLYYTNVMVQSVRKQERKNMKLWANATRALSMSSEFDASLEVLVEIIQSNDNIPVVLTDARKEILSYNNLDERLARQPGYLKRLVQEMETQHPPIVIQDGSGITNYIFYSDSNLLYQLRYYPLFQLLVICVFLAIAYAAFSASRRYEQDFLWVGMAKETAHQLGTPISSLMALHARLENDNIENNSDQDGGWSTDQGWVSAFAKDINRLENIAERFSKIGSTPILRLGSLEETLLSALDYLQPRSPSSVRFIKKIDDRLPQVPHNKALMEWVIENLIKNSLDAMPQGGEILFRMHTLRQSIVLDVTDTGKGIPRSRHRLIFRPGISTRKRGWGLGLTLAKRIVELNHRGRIKVLYSEPGKGTTFRIQLPLQQNPVLNRWQNFRDRLGLHRLGGFSVCWAIPAVLGLFTFWWGETSAQGATAIQGGYRTQAKALWQVHTTAGVYLPGGNLKERFGTLSLVGPELIRQSPSRRWTMGLRGGHLFGALVRETQLFGSVATPSGDIINANGVFEDYRLRPFGWFVEGRAGWLVFPQGPGGSGWFSEWGLGALQHKIWIETPNNNSPQLTSDYKMGYDRLCDGLSLSQSLGYHYLSASKRVNFRLGLEFIWSQTRERRTVRYDTGQSAHDRRHDFLSGIRLAWILPLYERSEKSDLYFE
ncbi:MAG: sensor histidine kinase [Bacteroidota bacterium]